MLPYEGVYRTLGCDASVPRCLVVSGGPVVAAWQGLAERELPLPTQRMALLDEEIKGIGRLRYVAGLLYGGEQEASGRWQRLIPDEEVRRCSPSSRWRGLARPDEVVPRLVQVPPSLA